MATLLKQPEGSAVQEQIRYVTTDGKELFRSSLEPGSYVVLQSYTDTQLNDVSHAVNTNKGKAAGVMVWNTTQGHAVWAAGNADADVWVDGTGSTINSPV